MTVEYPGLQLSWRRVLAIAQDQQDPVSKDTADHPEEQEEQQSAFTQMQCIDRALGDIYTITSQGHGYVAFMVTMLTELRHDCPVSMAFVKHTIDCSEIPSKETLQQATHVLLTKVDSNSSAAAAAASETRINAAILWSLLAQKFAGNLAEALWTDTLGKKLLEFISKPTSGRGSMLPLFSLLALESFALTGSIKQKLIQQGIIGNVLQDILASTNTAIRQMQHVSPSLSTCEEEEYSPNLTLASSIRHSSSFNRRRHLYQGLKSALKTCKSKLRRRANSRQRQDDFRLLSSYFATGSNHHGESDYSMELIQVQNRRLRELRQLQFGLSWSLDNVFHKKGSMRKPQVPMYVSLQCADKQSRCKLSRDGLEVRNDTFSLESVRSSAYASNKGKWYYEILLLTDGTIKAGWGALNCLLSSEDGSGIGDDANGFAFDTHRCAVWTAGNVASFSKGDQQDNHGGLLQCRAGDVLGSLLDLDNSKCTFYINGQDYGFTLKLKTKSGTSSFGPLYPTISLTGYTQLVVNLGRHAWLCKPPCNDIQTLSCLQPKKQLVSKLLKKSKSTTAKATKISAECTDGSSCSICLSEPRNTKLLPCRHDGFGENCSEAFTVCPLCRADIDKIVVYHSP